MKKILFLLFFALVACTYTYEVYHYEGTSWTYEGDIIKNDISADVTEITFTKNNVFVTENGALVESIPYEFNAFKRYIQIGDLGSVERVSYGRMNLEHNGKDYIFSLKL